MNRIYCDISPLSGPLTGQVQSRAWSVIARSDTERDMLRSWLMTCPVVQYGPAAARVVGIASIKRV